MRGHEAAEAPVQLVMPADLPLAQRMAFDPRVGEKRRAERPVTECRDAAPRTTHVVRVDHRVRKYDRRVAAIQKHLPDEHAPTSAVREQKAFVAIRSAHALEYHAHVHTGTAPRNARREGAAVPQPGSIRTRGNRSRPPPNVADRNAHAN